MIQESLINPHAFTLLFKNRYALQKLFHNTMGSNPHLIKKMPIYTKNNRSSKKISN